MRIRVGMAQMLVEGGRIAENLARAEAMIQSAADQGCQMVLLPECSDLGWAWPQARELAERIPGEVSKRLEHAAKRSRVYVVSGLTERCRDEVFNSAVLISPQGELLAKHRKINLLSDVEGIYSVGNSLSVARTPFGTVGLNICADNFPDSLALGQAQALMGARLLLSPCAWAVRPEHDNELEPYGSLWKNSYTTLAKLGSLTVMGVSSVGVINDGPWKGYKCIGCSLAVGPDGRILASGPYGQEAESLILVEVETEPCVEASRSNGL